MSGLKEDLLEAADGLAKRCDCGGGAYGSKHGPGCVSEYAPIIRLHASSVEERERELLDLRERLAFSRAGNATLTECGAGMAAELAYLRVRLGEAVALLRRLGAWFEPCPDCDEGVEGGCTCGPIQPSADEVRAFFARTLETP